MNLIFLFVSIFVQFEFYFIHFVKCAEDVKLSSHLSKKPELESKWEESNSGGWFFEGEDLHGGVRFYGDDIIVSSWVTTLLVICSAHYPVYWDYDNAKANVQVNNDASSMFRSITLSTHRTSEDFNDPTSYKYYAYLRLRGDGRVTTGNYTCRSATNENLTANRFVFWEGSTRNLIYGEGGDTYSSTCTTNSCRDRPSITVMADQFNETITLPCSVCHPKVHVKLFKRNTTKLSGYDEIKPLNNSIVFDAKLGFILMVQELPSPYGVYKCLVSSTVGYRNDEILIVNATADISRISTIRNNTLSGKAKYYFDKDISHIVCCSNGTKPPRIYRRDCRTKYNCEKAKTEVQNFEHFDRSNERPDNCRSSAVKVSRNSGVFRCYGEGIDVTREYYFPPEHEVVTDEFEFDDEILQFTPIFSEPNSRQSKIYYDEEIYKLPKTQFLMMSVSARDIKNYSVEVYTNETIFVHCSPSNYLFTHGVRWSLTLRNRTTSVVPIPPGSLLANYLSLDISNSMGIQVTNELTSITCHAPFFSSSEWVNKSITLNITQSVSPSIIGQISENVTWVLGESNKELKCNATGIPGEMLYTWEDRFGDAIHNLQEHIVVVHGDSPHRRYGTSRHLSSVVIDPEVMSENGTSKLVFKKIRESMAGTYTCEARNLVGSVTKTFTVGTIATELTSTVNPLQKTTTVTTPRSTTTVTSTPKSTTTLPNLITTPIHRPRETRKRPPAPADDSMDSILVFVIVAVCFVLIGGGIGGTFLLIRIRRQRRLKMNQDSCISFNQMASSASKLSLENIGY